VPNQREEATGGPWTIVPLRDEADAVDCARIMCGSEPWITLGRDYEKSLAIVRMMPQDRFVALDADGAVAGFILLLMEGAFTGYLRSIAVREDCRSRGLGEALMAFAESHVFRRTPNVFLCVSAFNERARAFYERLGYRLVGPLPDYVAPGYTEWLMRKSVGALDGFGA
jgi:ribosomal protein S18 acetylase RimI-like enzyme